jgi:hypothetical protein
MPFSHNAARKSSLNLKKCDAAEIQIQQSPGLSSSGGRGRRVPEFAVFPYTLVSARNISIQCLPPISEKIRILLAHRFRHSHCHQDVRAVPLLKEETTMLWTIFVILLVLWLVGLVSSYTFGGFIHLLLVLAVIVLVINLLTGRSTV